MATLSSTDHHLALTDATKPQLAYRTEGNLDEWRAALRERIAALLGLAKITAPDEVAAEVEWTEEIEGGSLSRLILRCESGLDMNAYWSVPVDVAPPYPTVICLQGHNTGAHVSVGRPPGGRANEPFVAEGDRDFANAALANGFAALSLEQRGFGERSRTGMRVSDVGTDCRHAAMQALMLGRTLIGERVFDVDRVLAYLQQRGDVDMGRVGVLGNSGGGTTSIYSAALLDRLAFAVPSCSLATSVGSVMSIVHCGCNYVPGLLAWADQGDILAAFAPKPLVVVAGRDDDIFPLASVREAFATVQRAYADQGAEDACTLVVGEGGHRFYADQAWSALRDRLG